MENRNQEYWDAVWLNKFSLLLKYKELYGTVNVPHRYANPECPEWERKLGSWCNTQRNKFKKGKLLSWRHDKLVAEGFDFNPFDTMFEEHYSDLLKFKEKYGHVLVPQECVEFNNLGTWVTHLRCHNIILSEERKKMLEEVGFTWDILEEYWQKMFNQLAEYKKEHGHCKVSEKRKGYEQLGTWVVRMRKAKRHGTGQKITDEQIKLLDSIDFNWEPIEDDWNRNFNNLLLFKEEHKHCLVPIRRCKIKGLGWWVFWLRQNKNKLSDKQVQQLDAIEFEWNSDLAYRKRNNIKNINSSAI